MKFMPGDPFPENVGLRDQKQHDAIRHAMARIVYIANRLLMSMSKYPQALADSVP
jgi:hypothetical protein